MQLYDLLILDVIHLYYYKYFRNLDDSLEVISFGIDVDKHLQSRNIEGRDWNQNPPVIVTTGFLRRHKGVPALLRAMPTVLEQFPTAILHVRCALYPSEDSRQELELCMSEVDRLQLKGSVFIDTDFLDKAVVLSKIRKADVAVLPYEKSNEGGSATAADCLAVGLPLIVSDAEIFDEIRAVALTTQPDAQHIADAILWILKNAEGYALLAEQSISFARANSWNIVPGAFLAASNNRFNNFVATHRMDLNQLYDMQIIEVMKCVLAHDSNAIDIGCHRGSMLTEILKIAPDGRHFAFEPLPDMFAHLQADFGSNLNVSLHNFALSDTSGSVTFQHVVSNPGYSGLRQRSYDRDNEQIVEMEVRTERLDDIVPRYIDIRFIKIDVQGAELGVLRGAVGTIRRCKPAIVFEHGLGAADCYGTKPEEVFDLLVSCGLHCFTMELWLASGGEKCLDRGAFAEEFRSGRSYCFLAA